MTPDSGYTLLLLSLSVSDTAPTATAEPAMQIEPEWRSPVCQTGADRKADV